MAQARSPRKRHWCFTSFVDDLPVAYNKEIVRYIIYQREECPDTKKQHWQGYIEFYDNVRIGQVKKIIGESHLEFRKGTRTEAREYCRKADTAIAGTVFEFGVWREEVTRKRKLSDMLRTDMTLDELIEQDPHLFVMYHRGLKALFSLRSAKKAKLFRKVVVTVYIGPTGSGKTRRACQEPDHFFLPCSEKTWFDGYKGESCLILDDFYGNIKYSQLLRILDGYEIQLPVKGGFIWGMWTKVIITSNAEPSEWYKMGFTPALRRRINFIIQLANVVPMSFV